jgi:hypothetical protein
MTTYHKIMALETTDRRGMTFDLDVAHDAIILEFARFGSLRTAAQKKAVETEEGLKRAKNSEAMAFAGAFGEGSWQANNGPALTLLVETLKNRLIVLRMLGYGEKPPAGFGLISLNDAFQALVGSHAIDGVRVK